MNPFEEFDKEYGPPSNPKIGKIVKESLFSSLFGWFIVALGFLGLLNLLLK